MNIHLASSLGGLLFTLVSFGQKAGNVKSQSLSLELGKNGLIYNLCYDYRFGIKKIGLRFMAGSNFAKYLNVKSAGGGVYRLFGKEKHYFETGVDIQYLAVDEVSDDQRGFHFVKPAYSIKSYYLSLNSGYRYNGENTLIRIGISPGFIKDGFIPGGYISVGLLF